ncbi:hypothetical protein DDE23_05435 [Pararhodobacter aggregans]|uniref:Uncharacterized protein n=1 Tax=Pararhodobacter aggregans TaxID=404875 RepID=A0A2T7UVA3_9RHOB|nr:hypothetical protein DDE23_05435 [Pararhodobacter aggregans]
MPDRAVTTSDPACDPPLIAARLVLESTPAGRHCGLRVNGRKMRVTEPVPCENRHGRIAPVCPVIDKAALEAQLSARLAAAWDGLARRLTRAAKPLIFLASPGVPCLGQAVQRAKRKAP